MTEHFKMVPLKKIKPFISSHVKEIASSPILKCICVHESLNFCPLLFCSSNILKVIRLCESLVFAMFNYRQTADVLVSPFLPLLDESLAQIKRYLQQIQRDGVTIFASFKYHNVRCLTPHYSD